MSGQSHRSPDSEAQRDVTCASSDACREPVTAVHRRFLLWGHGKPAGPYLYRECLLKIFEESDITIQTIDAHLRDSGVVPYAVQSDYIPLRSERGIAFTISIIPNRKFIRFSTYLPLTTESPIAQKHELARRLNEEVFMPVFTIDGDGDLIVAYSLPYTGGLVAATLASIANRFASLLEFVTETYNDGLIAFGAPSMATVGAAESRPANTELLH